MRKQDIMTLAYFVQYVMQAVDHEYDTQTAWDVNTWHTKQP